MPLNGFDWVHESPRLAAPLQNEAGFLTFMAHTLLAKGTRRVVDFGCGHGDMAAVFHSVSTANGWNIDVTGLDPDPMSLQVAIAKYPDVRFAAGSFTDGSQRLRTTLGGNPELVWTRDALHHAPQITPALVSLVELLTNHGTLAVAEGYSTTTSIPENLEVGTPGLQQRLDACLHCERATHSGPNPIPYKWFALLKTVGLTDVTTHRVPFDEPLPLQGIDLEFVLSSLTTQVEWANSLLSQDDQLAWGRLLDPADRAWLGHRDDMWFQPVAEVHVGTKSSLHTFSSSLGFKRLTGVVLVLALRL